jgi:membrane protein involved in colicin uptake
MIESPVLQEFVREREQAAKEKAAKEAAKNAAKAAKQAARQSSFNNILMVLAARLGDEAQAVAPELDAVDETRFDDLLRSATTCSNLASFREFLANRS